jgi:hypothetical protein
MRRSEPHCETGIRLSVQSSHPSRSRPSTLRPRQIAVSKRLDRRRVKRCLSCGRTFKAAIASASSTYGVVDRARPCSDCKASRTDRASSWLTCAQSVRRSRCRRRSGRSGSAGNPSTMSRSSPSVRPTRGPPQQCPIYSRKSLSIAARKFAAALSRWRCRPSLTILHPRAHTLRIIP